MGRCPPRLGGQDGLEHDGRSAPVSKGVEQLSEGDSRRLPFGDQVTGLTEQAFRPLVLAGVRVQIPQHESGQVGVRCRQVVTTDQSEQQLPCRPSFLQQHPRPR